MTETLRKRIRNRPTLPRLVDETKIQDILKWAAGGFAALVALLTFFGVKDGVLARVVHQNPIAAIAVLVLVGFGTLLTLAAPIADPKAQLLWAVALFVGMVILVTTELVTGNVSSPWADKLNGLRWAAIIITLALALACLVLRTTLSLGLGLAALAVTSTSAGLYAAAKVAILDDLAGGAVSVVGTFAQSEGALKLTVEATGQASYGPTRLAIAAADADGKPLASPGSAILLPDQAGVLKGSVTVFVPNSARSVVVLACHQSDASGPACTPSDEQVHLVVPGQPARLGAVLTTTAGGGLSYVVSGSGLQSLSAVVVEIGPPGAPPVFRSNVAPSIGGEVSLTGIVATTVPSQSLVVSARRCHLDGACDTAVELARYAPR